MNLYLPLWLYRVRYELAWGRPYSEIDTLVMQSLSKRAATVEELCIEFALRKSLIVEVLVTLARAGWVALDIGPGAFYTTAAGTRALSKNELPPFVNLEQPRPETIVVERLQGGIASRTEVHFQTAFALRKDPQFTPDAQLKGDFLARRLDAGQVDGLLPCEPPRWLHWVDTPVCVSETHWLCVNVDLDRGEINGLPERWRRSLGPELLDIAAKRSGRSKPVDCQSELAAPMPALSRSYPIELQQEDLLATPEAHAPLLVQSLREAATSVYVASAFFNPTALGPDTRQAILDALHRGIHVGLLWGYEEGTAARRAVQWMEAIRKEAPSVGGNLHFNETASGSHAKFLFHDPDGIPTLHVGSYNWLSSPSHADSTSPMNLTIRVRDRELLAELLRTFAALWLNVPRSQWSPSAAHLQQIASDLARSAVSAPPCGSSPARCSVRVIRDQEHEAVMFEMLNAMRERCWVASHKLGQKASIRLAPLLDSSNQPPKQATINYELSFIDEARLANLKAELALRGISLEGRPQMHAKCVIVDQSAMISSFNFLSADPFNNSSNAREVGLLIEGGLLPTELWKRFVGTSA